MIRFGEKDLTAKYIKSLYQSPHAYWVIGWLAPWGCPAGQEDRSSKGQADRWGGRCSHCSPLPEAALLLNRIPSFPDPQEGSCKPHFFIPSIIPSFSKPPPNSLLSYSWTWSHPLSPSLSGNSQVLRVCIIVLCWNILYLFFKSSILPEAQGMFFLKIVPVNNFPFFRKINLTKALQQQDPW